MSASRCLNSLISVGIEPWLNSVIIIIIKAHDLGILGEDNKSFALVFFRGREKESRLIK